MVNNIQKKKIVYIGAGNVATHLAKALDKDNDVIAVFSRNFDNADALAKCLKNAEPFCNLAELPKDADYYIISVKDDLIGDIAKAVNTDSGIWAHTSGTVPAQIFDGIKSRFGVFYPLQTFNKTKAVDVNLVPMFIEGSNEKVTDDLITLAKTISTKVSIADSVARKRFHLAAVFACNFVNRMWGIADEILQDGGYDLSILEPLMKVSLDNAVKYRPINVQTGPARRGDVHVIESQIASLPNDELKAIYRLVTDSIINKYSDK